MVLWLPLVLDEPFERLDARGTAALVAVLDVFCRQGHQVFVFTRKQDATERLASIGAAVHNIASLRRWQRGLPWPAGHHRTAEARDDRNRHCYRRRLRQNAGRMTKYRSTKY